MYEKVLSPSSMVGKTLDMAQITTHRCHLKLSSTPFGGQVADNLLLKGLTIPLPKVKLRQALADYLYPYHTGPLAATDQQVFIFERHLVMLTLPVTLPLAVMILQLHVQ